MTNENLEMFRCRRHTGFRLKITHDRKTYSSAKIWPEIVIPYNCSSAVIGKFPIALNCAELSPDGKWLAVVGDSQMVFVCPMDKVLEGRVMRYRTSSSTSRGEVFMPHVIKLSLPSKRTKSAGGVRFPDGVSHRPFSQYCKWNSESSLLAATSDNGNG